MTVTETENRLHDALIAIVATHVRDPRVLRAMRSVPRHLFVLEHAMEDAYEDRPLGIGFGVTISQPTVVGMMSEALALQGNERVLEIGTGSGYQAAVLSLLARSIDTIEVVSELASRARRMLWAVPNVRVHRGDGWRGLPGEYFDRIVVTAAPEMLPPALLEQLAPNGLLVAPVGPQSQDQRLERHQKRGDALVREDLGAVRFVPLVHQPR